MQRGGHPIPFKFQTEGFQCGAYALYNLLLLQNKTPVSWQKCIRLCNAQPVVGTLAHNMTRALYQCNACIQEYHDITVYTILQRSTSILLFHWEHKRYSGEHYAVVHIVDNQIHMLNFSFDIPVRILSHRELKTLLIPFVDTKTGERFPRAWA